MGSAAPSPVAPATASKMSILGSLTSELDKLAPRFEVDAERIQVIRGPAEFYLTLKVIS
jgi:CDP-diacylglycerol--glycerol-3-phosphate 3-phosphatidyltransferase